MTEKDLLIQDLKEELRKYKEVGTLEEVKEAKEKQISRKSGLHAIASHYGPYHQSRKLIGEMAELTVALSKYWDECCPQHNSYEWLQNIYSEMADVEVLMEQLKILFACHAEVKALVDYKIKRTIERMEEKDGR